MADKNLGLDGLNDVIIYKYEALRNNKMNKQRIKELINFYDDTLFKNVIPFWEQYSIDREYGGYLHYLDTKGNVIGSDKAIWLQGRECWLFSKLYSSVSPEPRWLEYAKIGYDFIKRYGFDSSGKMYFSVTREGMPLRMRRYYFSEAFFIIACAEYSRASGDRQAMSTAKRLFAKTCEYYFNPDPNILPPKMDPYTRPMIGHAVPMILISTAQILRECNDYTAEYDELIEQLIDTIFSKFVKDEYRALLETVTPEGNIIDTPEGRTINPGHAIETSWFLMNEGIYRNNFSIIEKACDILSWSFDWGWDEKYSGLFSFVDLFHLPPEKMEWDMKYWWPHNELIYASLLAYHLTGKEKFENMFDIAHNYAFSKFADNENGEWFGYLHRDGSVALKVKGTMYKGAFHLPRQLLYTKQLLEKMEY